MLPCSNIKCPHYRVKKEIDYAATMGMTPFSMHGMPKLTSYGECRYSYCKLRTGRRFRGRRKK